MLEENHHNRKGKMGLHFWFAFPYISGSAHTIFISIRANQSSTVQQRVRQSANQRERLRRRRSTRVLSCVLCASEKYSNKG